MVMASGQVLLLQKLKGIRIRAERAAKMLGSPALDAVPMAIADKISQASALMADVELALQEACSVNIKV